MTNGKIRPRADHVGSLLRPERVKRAREQLFERGALARFGQVESPADIKDAEDA